MGIDSSSIVEAMFERGGLKTVFEHVKDTVVATVVVAAGMEASRLTDDNSIASFLFPSIAGYVVAGIGCLLILLNFVDGLRRLAKFRQNYLLQAGLSVVYLFASLRIVQLVIMLRTNAF